MKNIFCVALLSLCISSSASADFWLILKDSGIDIVEQPKFHQVKDLLKEFHAPTNYHGEDTGPDVISLAKDNRIFVAKVADYNQCSSIHFTFKNNDDVKFLVENMRKGKGYNIFWYYLDDANKH